MEESKKDTVSIETHKVSVRSQGHWLNISIFAHRSDWSKRRLELANCDMPNDCVDTERNSRDSNGKSCPPKTVNEFLNWINKKHGCIGEVKATRVMCHEDFGMELD